MLAIASLMFWQSGDELSGKDIHILMFCGVVIAAALVVQSIGLVIAAIAAKTVLQKVQGMADTAEQKISPVLAKTNALLEDLGPKVRSISTNVEQISYTVREKCDELGQTLSELNRTVADVNLKTRVHVAKVDELVTDALVTTEQVQKTVQEGIKMPVRQIAGVVAGVKAAIDTLVARSPFGKKKGYESPYDL